MVFLAVWRRLAFLQRCLANYNARKKLIKKHSKSDKFIVSLALNIVKFSLKRSSCKWKEQTFLTKQRMSIFFSIFIVYDSFLYGDQCKLSLYSCISIFISTVFFTPVLHVLLTVTWNLEICSYCLYKWKISIVCLLVINLLGFLNIMIYT